MSKTHVLYLSIAPGTLKDLVRWTGFNKLSLALLPSNVHAEFGTSTLDLQGLRMLLLLS
jgi:hypothetical protein